jgi:FKBP-type peptidyl-prolyl cis-trans isomerase (trigger factor)
MTKETKNNENSKNYKINNKEEKKRILELEIEIDSNFVESQKDKALKELGKDFEIKGFRKGTVPKNILEKEINILKVYEEQAFQAINSILPDIMLSEKIDSITQPKISIIKLAPENPLVIKAEFILMPIVELPEYKTLAKNIKLDTGFEASQKEIDDYVEYLLKMKTEANALKMKTSADPKEREEAQNQKNDLPKFDDEFVKTLGEFNSVEEFMTELKKNIKKEKEEKNKQKRRVEIIEKIISETKTDIPEILVEEELQRMFQQFYSDIKSMKMDPQEYLNEIKKTEEDLKKEWQEDAKKRAVMNFVLPKIAMLEKIKIDQEKINHEVEHIKEHHPEINEQDARIYFSQLMTNEAVFEFLENLK